MRLVEVAHTYTYFRCRYMQKGKCDARVGENGVAEFNVTLETSASYQPMLLLLLLAFMLLVISCALCTTNTKQNHAFN